MYRGLSLDESFMNRLFLLPSSIKRDPAIDRWLDSHAGELGAIARRWFEVMRDCGDDVREVLHDCASQIFLRIGMIELTSSA